MDKIICYNCNGLGEKTRSRGNHSSIFKVTKCYTCNGTGELETSEESLKDSIIYHLKKLDEPEIKTNITLLWNQIKTWCKDRNYIMGGSYVSNGNKVNAKILIKPKIFKFSISFTNLN